MHSSPPRPRPRPPRRQPAAARAARRSEPSFPPSRLLGAWQASGRRPGIGKGCIHR